MAVGVNIVSHFDGKGIQKAIAGFKKLEGGALKSGYALQTANNAAKAGGAAFKKMLLPVAALGYAGLKLAKMGEEAAVANARILQVNKSMNLFGASVYEVSTRVQELAKAQSLQTGFDINEIKAGAAKILTFRAVAKSAEEVGGQFDRTLQAAIDLSATGFGDITKTSVQLGKAMQDPIKGMTALKRVGVTFTKQEKEQIKMLVEGGKEFEARAVILKAVESQVGGVAAATATASHKMSAAFHIATEDIGTLLLPAMQALQQFVSTKLVPTMDGFGQVTGAQGAGAGIEFLIGKVINGISGLGAFGKTVLVIVGAMKLLNIATVIYTTTLSAMKIVMQTTVVTAGMASVALMATAAAVSLLAIAAVGFVVYASQKAKATQATLDLVAALKLEKGEQFAALTTLMSHNKITKEAITAATKLGFSVNDIAQYTEKGTGKFAEFMAVQDGARITSKGVVGAFEHIATALFGVGENQAAVYGLTGKSIIAFEDARNKSLEYAAAQAGVARAMGDVIGATIIMNEALGIHQTKAAAEHNDLLRVAGATKVLSAEQIALNKLIAEMAAGLPPTSKGLSTQAAAVAAAAEKVSKYTSALQGFGSAQKAATDAVKALASAQLAQGNAIDDLRVAQDKFNKVSQGYGAGSKEAEDATKNLAQAQRDATRASIAQRQAVQSVTDAQQKLDDLKSGKATNRATEDLASATAQVADAQKKLDAAYIQGGQDTIGDAVSRLNDAYDKQKQATDAVREAQDASDPAAIAKAEDDLTTAKLDLVEQTIAQDDANQLVIDSQTLLTEAVSGAATTTDVYKEAQKELAETLKAVADANDVVTQSLLDQADAQRQLNLAKTGVTEAAKGTTKGQEKSAQRRTGVDPKTGETTVSAKSRLDFLDIVNKQFGTTFKSIKAFIASGETDDDKARKKKRYNDFAEVNGLVMMASGGIVNKPTIAMIGEAGAEAVVPLDKMNNGSTFNITVNAGVGDPVAIGREVVSVLQAYQRRSGAIPIKVA